jgi:GWxTD domain-containing protein
LDEKYQKWWDLVAHISTPIERSVFLNLTNNRDRDSFISLFWNQRDPSQGTPENEFKEEHMKRFNHASYYFGFGSPLPGWKTDRGRIWILLGPPISRNEVNSNGIYPVEIWEYYGNPEIGLPTAFRVVFYKKSGAGDYRLYIPTVDGPGNLLVRHTGEFEDNDYVRIYQKLRELNPQVAEVSLSLIPGEEVYNFSPSLQSPILMSKIYELPKRAINSSYARNFLDFKGVVDVSVTTNYINSRCDLAVFPDPILKLNMIHFSILPERLSVDYSEEKDKYYFSYQLTALLKKGESVIFQYSKNYPFYYSKEELEGALSHGLVIADYFPAVDGEFEFSAIIENSVNREITYFEKKVKVVSPTPGLPKVWQPIMSHQISRANQLFFSSYNFVEDKVMVDPRREFGTREVLFSYFCAQRGGYKGKLKVALEVKNQLGYNEYHKVYPFEFPEGRDLYCFKAGMENPGTGTFSVETKVMDQSGKVLSSASNDFSISPLAAIPHPPSASKKLARSNQFLIYMMLGRQYESLGKDKSADANYSKALAMNPRFPELVKVYAAFLFKAKEYDRVIEVLEGIKGIPEAAFEYYSYKGKAYYRKGFYDMAVENLLKANAEYDSDVSVLNALGAALIHVGEKGEAHKVLTASLKINPEQPEIAKLLRRLDEEINKK